MSIIKLSLTKLVITGIGVIALLAFALVIILLFKVNRMQRRYEKYTHISHANNKKHIDSFEISSALQSSSSRRIIRDLVKEEISNILHHPDKSLMEQISDVVYADIRPMLMGDLKELTSERSIGVVDSPNAPITMQQTSPAQTTNARIFYASALLEEDDKTFYNVSEQPVSDETIFKFTEIKNGKCEFVVYEGAYSKVLTDASFLTGACRVTKIGNSRVVVTEKGIAELTNDNKWVVLEPAKVKLE